jgi:glycyl-tRNA synthetase beta chain
VPEGCVPVAVALADRADTIAQFFGVGLMPTGSKDPFALRRAMLGIINMVRRGELRLPITALFHSVPNAPIFGFLQDRLRVQVREEGVRPDIVDGTLFWNGNEDIVSVVRLAAVLQAFVETDEGKNLLAGYKRAANILKAEEKKDGRAYAFDASIPLSTLFDEADALLAAEDFEGAMKLLATLRAPVDAFFEQTTVNDPDPDTRARRLGLLAAIRGLMHRVADFSKIEG